MSKILITGGTGSLGREIIKQLLKNKKTEKIISLSRDENKIQKLYATCRDERLTCIVRDIRNPSLDDVFKNVDTVIHTASMKHIDLCEKNVDESLSVNITGTENLLKHAKKYSIGCFIGITSDKAVSPSSLYGATKMIQEKLILDMNTKTDGRYFVVRCGNFFWSDGSVLDVWQETIKKYGKIGVTNEDMTRFFIMIKYLAQFIINLKNNGVGGKIYIPPHKVIRIGDLANAMISVFGGEKEPINMRLGEKIDEVLYRHDEKNIVSSFPSEKSKYVPLSKDEIKEWLLKCQK